MQYCNKSNVHGASAQHMVSFCYSLALSVDVLSDVFYIKPSVPSTASYLSVVLLCAAPSLQAVVSQVMSVQLVSCCDQGVGGSSTLVDLGPAGQLRLHRQLSLAGEEEREGHSLCVCGGGGEGGRANNGLTHGGGGMGNWHWACVGWGGMRGEGKKGVQ